MLSLISSIHSQDANQTNKFYFNYLLNLGEEVQSIILPSLTIMRLSTPLLVLATGLAVTVQADRWDITGLCSLFGCNYNTGKWYYNDGRSFNFNPNEGCRVPYIPAVKEFCMDWGNRRAHFYEDSGKRRCMRQVRDDSTFCGTGCLEADVGWADTACTW
ncbi:hypothetical protein ONS95_001510 [Cadophora gregata]|uniref:uncharacterized protein n=1 Tax=Cadophora gregata TaxID=51156 RepID=UPI0026DADA6A|nr:uncharacterized protein ONS95_001510 [Cadophora gregata]KAK0111134.1 hypothetical protein ONS95_001510 [Cadophora gregata]KAK0112399.1 hypothetical protein ONS96_001643 [Cadophora gregata f. sp. sojae]